MNFKLFNTLTNSEEIFTPKNPSNIKMYVCGPTVYERPHLGNARSIVFYDLLFRILKVLYPSVTYVRNITDVDDKIINQAVKEKISVSALTSRVIGEFRDDISILNCQSPTFEPKATEFIHKMIEIIKNLVEKGHGYIAENGDVIFFVKSFKEYGKLSNRKLEDLNAGSRIAISSAKHNEHDFVLWKRVQEGEVGWNSEFGFGRPGWHIECSAMSVSLLGMDFDIHGGGADLQFPHHENEIAQSECAFEENFARYWIHNGFLTVEGEKMSKSLGNFKTVKNLLDEGYEGFEIRFALLNTHYRKPLSFSNHLIETAKTAMKKFHKVLEIYKSMLEEIEKDVKWNDLPLLAQDAILSNINISKFTALMHSIANDIKNTNDYKAQFELVKQFYKMGLFIGIFN
jgi:cysteinyl-tRNA synthetase